MPGAGGLAAALVMGGPALAAPVLGQVGGGVRSIDRAQELLDTGARRVILGSSLFNDRGVNKARAEAFAEAIDPDVLIGAIDSKGGKVVIHYFSAPELDGIIDNLLS